MGGRSGEREGRGREGRWEQGGRLGEERKEGRRREREEERESGRKGGTETGKGKQQHLSPSCRFLQAACLWVREPAPSQSGPGEEVDREVWVDSSPSLSCGFPDRVRQCWCPERSTPQGLIWGGVLGHQREEQEVHPESSGSQQCQPLLGKTSCQDELGLNSWALVIRQMGEGHEQIHLAPSERL